MQHRHLPGAATAAVLLAAILASSACAADRSGTEAAAPEEPQATAGTAAPPSAGDPPAPTAAPLAAQRRDPNATAAKVNGIPIYEREILDAIRSIVIAQGGDGEIPDEQAEQARGTVLDALIGNELLYQKGKADGIVAAQSEVDEAIAEARASFQSEEEWLADLGRRGLDKGSIGALVLRDLTIQKTLKTKVFDRLSIGEAELKAYYDAHPDEMTRPEQARVSHILVRVPEGAGAGDRASAKTKADQALGRLKAGEDFATVAREMSDDPGSAARGGDLGMVGRGQTVPSFEEVVFSIQPGVLSDVVESTFGFHIIKVAERQASEKMPLSAVSEQLRNFLMQRKAREEVSQLIESLRTTAKIEML